MRIKYSELTARRALEAAHRRVKDMPVAVSWQMSSFAKMNRGLLEQFKDKHRGQRCFLIANGPSLSRMDLSGLKNEFTISMNRAYLLYDRWGFIPSYYVCANELVLEQFGHDIWRLPMPRFLNFNRRRVFADALGESLMYLRLGFGLRDYFSIDLTETLSSGGTVTFVGLQLAYYLGFNEVILIGLDHSFVEKGVPNATEVRQADRDESHCHPDYFPKGVKWQLPDLYRSELAYALARQAFEGRKRRIIDATVDGHCRVFEKTEFRSLL